MLVAQQQLLQQSDSHLVVLHTAIRRERVVQQRQREGSHLVLLLEPQRKNNHLAALHTVVIKELAVLQRQQEDNLLAVLHPVIVLVTDVLLLVTALHQEKVLLAPINQVHRTGHHRTDRHQREVLLLTAQVDVNRAFDEGR